MYYNRTISNEFANELSKGQFKWLIPYVKEHDDLDILIGKNNGKEYCSVYRGTSRIAYISRTARGHFKVEAADSYEMICPRLYSLDGFNEKNLEYLRSSVESQSKFDRYYNNRKEGYYQNMLQRRYGIMASAESDMLILDKEIVIGYADEREKQKIFSPNRERYLSVKSDLKRSNPKLFGEPSESECMGGELDLMALDRDGYIHLMEIKDGSNTSGIYMSPFQIGLYKRIFDMIDITDSVGSLIRQKQELGLLPRDWTIPAIRKEIIPELIICAPKSRSQSYPSRYNMVVDYIKSNAADIYEDIRGIVVRDENMNIL